MSDPGQHVLIIGAGFSGLGMGVRLKQAGIDSFTILEEGGGLGGTWRANTYPGAACDVPSHLYSFSFAPNPSWTRTFPTQPEILAYMEEVAARFGLGPHLRFGVRVSGARYDEERDLWVVSTAAGEEHNARVLVSACGGLSRPADPAIPGLSRFAGRMFHSARWPQGADLRGARVGVIGTGASAIQIVPKVAPQAERLHVFQRTPPWIMPHPDRPISPLERRLFRLAPPLQRLLRVLIYWQLEARVLPFTTHPRIMSVLEHLALRHLRKSVPDPALREALTPRYSLGCKRILISNEYYPALQRPGVELVTAPIEEVTAGGIRTQDGALRELDALILCTGFRASEAPGPFPVVGRGGVDLDERWAEGPEAFLGTAVAGFPNLFFLVGPNTGLGHSSMIFMIESQLDLVMRCVKRLRAERLRALEVRPEVEREFNHGLQARLGRTIWASGCKSWYLTRSGKNTTLWPGFTWEFRLRARRVPDEAFAVTRGSEQRPA